MNRYILLRLDLSRPELEFNPMKDEMTKFQEVSSGLQVTHLSENSQGYPRPRYVVLSLVDSFVLNLFDQSV